MLPAVQGGIELCECTVKMKYDNSDISVSIFLCVEQITNHKQNDGAKL